MGRRLILLLVTACAFCAVWWAMRRPTSPDLTCAVRFTVTTSADAHYDLFYDTTGTGFQADQRVGLDVRGSLDPQEITFRLPMLPALSALRLDPGEHNSTIALHGLRVIGPYRTLHWDAAGLDTLFTDRHHATVAPRDSSGQELIAQLTGTDPYLATGLSLRSATQAIWSLRRPIVRPLLVGSLTAWAVLFIARWVLRRRPHGRVASPRRRWHTAAVVLATVISVLVGWATLNLTSGLSTGHHALVLCLEGVFPKDDRVEVFYAASPGRFDGRHVVGAHVPGSPDRQLVAVELDLDSALDRLRIDPGSAQDTVWIDRLVFRYGKEEVVLPAARVAELFPPSNGIDTPHVVNGRLRWVMQGSDPNVSNTEPLPSILGSLTKRTSRPAFAWVAAVFMALFLFLGQLPRIDRWIGSGAMPVHATSMAVVFCLLIGLPLLSGLVPLEPDGVNTEKRILAARPAFDPHHALDYPSAFNAYYKDNFGFRKVLFRWNSLFYTCVLNTSPMPDRVVFGKDGWMFWMRGDALAQYRGLLAFTDTELERIAQVQEERRAWLAEQGIPYFLMIAPQKASIYPEKLPDRLHKVGNANSLDQLLAYLKAHTQVKVIDCRAQLKAAKEQEDVFYDVDTHWNPLGGFIGYTALMEQIAKDLPAAGPPMPRSWFTVVPDTNDEGDLATLIAVNDVRERITPMLYPKEPFRSRPTDGGPLPGAAYFRFDPVFRATPLTDGPRLLMFRDSFTVYMLPFLSEHFSGSTYVWSPVFIPEIVGTERPNVVVQEVMEIFIRDLLLDTQGRPSH